MSVDHRRIQRTLFRMQHDESFDAALREADPAALASTGLRDDDLARLLALPRSGVAADAGGKRRAQFLRNVGAELLLTTTWAARSGADVGVAESFPLSRSFHDAVVADASLPLAFVEHARERCRAAPAADALLHALLALESCMAQARRRLWARSSPEPGELVLSQRAEIVVVPAGALAAAGALRLELDGGGSAELPPLSSADVEHVLVLAAPRASPHALAEISVELLSADAGAFLLAAREPLGSGRLAELSDELGSDPAELRAFVASLVSEGLLTVFPAGG